MFIGFIVSGAGVKQGGNEKSWEWSRGFLQGRSLFSEERTTVLFAPATLDESWSVVCRYSAEDSPVGFAPGLSPDSLMAKRCTTIQFSSRQELRMVEHLLAVLAFWRGPGVIAIVDGTALPILDGSAEGWYRVLNDLPNAAWGWKSYPVEPFCKEWRWENGFLRAESAEAFSVDYQWNAEEITQSVHLSEASSQAQFEAGDVIKHLWNARTFISESELEQALEQGLFSPHPGDGVVWRAASGELEIVEGGSLRFPDEFAWHKVADLIGDLSLFRYGVPQLKITARNSGHFHNHQLVKSLHRTLRS